VTDAAILATNSDGALIVARFGQTKREQLAHVVGNLRDVGAPLLGAIFAMAPARGSASYSYSYYGNAGAQRPSPTAPPDDPMALDSSPSSTTSRGLAAAIRHPNRHYSPKPQKS
jgi:receptor protein-tyrosine kinase